MRGSAFKMRKNDRPVAGDDAWRKHLMGRLADAQVEMWCEDDQHAPQPPAAPTQKDSRPKRYWELSEPSPGLAPSSGVESPAAGLAHAMLDQTPAQKSNNLRAEPPDFAIWDKLDGQRKIVSLINRVVADGTTKSRRAVIISGLSGFALVVAVLALAAAQLNGADDEVTARKSQPEVLSFAPTGKGTGTPKPARSANVIAENQISGTNSNVTVASLNTATPARTAPQNILPVSTKNQDEKPNQAAPAAQLALRDEASSQFTVQMVLDVNDAEDVLLPIGLKLSDLKEEEYLIVEGVPANAQLVPGLKLPGGAWVLEPQSLGQLQYARKSSSRAPVSMRFALFQNPDVLKGVLNVRVNFRTPPKELIREPNRGSGREEAQEESRPARQQVAKVRNNTHNREVASSGDDDERQKSKPPAPEPQQRSRPQKTAAQGTSSLQGERSGLGAKPIPAEPLAKVKPKPTSAPANPVIQVPKKKFGTEDMRQHYENPR